jgi:hypothetical protein
MYGWLWESLPGSNPVKTVLTALIFFVFLALLFLVVFPAVDSWLPIDESEISSMAAAVRSVFT